MRKQPLLAALVVLVVSQLGALCATRIQIGAPGHHVEEFSFEVSVDVLGDFVPGSVEIELNGESILDRLGPGPAHWSGIIDPGVPLRDLNFLRVKARDAKHGQVVRRLRVFAYDPPGKASARKIRFKKDLIRGPLAHSRKGDWLLENGEARFVIQDVGQRELYSVGQYGGNIIDAELVGNPGKDNFLEVQPGLNVESVINAQTVEIVNDGQDGAAAIVRTCGPDDLLDFVNPSSQVTDLGLPFPALADDRDLEIEGCTSYSLEPGDRHVTMETEVFNNYDPMNLPMGIPEPLPLVVGDWINPAGELDIVVRPALPPSGFSPASNGVGPPVASTLGTLGFYGFDEGAGTDYAFTQVPLDPPFAAVGSFALISGVLVSLHSQNVLLTLVGLDPIRFRVPAGGSGSYTRFFGVGDGSGSNAFDLENEVKGIATGTLEGCVTVAGTPVEGARVVVGPRLLTGLAASNPLSDELASHFTTRPGPCPNYSGTVPARVDPYQAAAALEGHPYEGGGSLPPLHPVSISAGMTTVQDFDLPATGRLRVEVVDAAGNPTPARVTVVGFDPSPEPISAGPSLPGFGGDDVGLFEDVDDFLPFGIPAVGYADASGVVELDLEPGVGAYHVFVSRGTEYSAFRTASPMTITAGNTTLVAAQIARVIDTAGFVSSDFHVHGIRSADSRVSDLHRVQSYSAEGVENVIMTDHHQHSDLRPKIAETGLSDFLTSTIGEEITTFDYGHFNAYPLMIDPDSPHPTFTLDGQIQLSGGSTDWAQAAPPGEDFPVYGAFNATPAQILQLATVGDLSVPGITTAQINHIGSHFAPLKIDTSLVPPADQMTDTDRANRRLPDTSSVPNLFQAFPALELWNGDSRGDQRQFLEERIGIWFNHLNQGLRATFIADTDSHRFTNLNTAGARTWTASPTDAPAWIDPPDVAASVDAGRAVGGQGVYVQTRLLATDGSGDVADLGWNGDTTMTDAGGNVVLRIEVQSPSWAAWDTVEVYASAATFPTVGSPYLFGAVPTVVLDEGDCDPTTAGDGDFDVDVTPDIGGVPGADRLSATLDVPFNGLTDPTWFVVVVKGTDGECAGMFPMYPHDLAHGPGLNDSLVDLVDGNTGENGVLALGATNALYFEP